MELFANAEEGWVNIPSVRAHPDGEVAQILFELIDIGGGSLKIWWEDGSCHGIKGCCEGSEFTPALSLLGCNTLSGDPWKEMDKLG